MKSLLLLIPLFAGCTMFAPVPKTTISGVVGGQKFSLTNPKNTSISNLLVEVFTNGNARLSIGALSSTNDVGVIDKSFAGQALVIQKLSDAAHQALMDGAAIAGKGAAAAAGKP